MGLKPRTDASFKTGTVLIQDGHAFFKFNKFYDKLKSKDWKYSEGKTGAMMMKTYKDCGIEFMEQKRFPSQRRRKI